MKTKLQRICIVLLALAALGIINGCATTDYYRLKQTRMDVDFAMTRYNNQVTFGNIAPSFQTQVNAAYQAYKTAFDAAVQQAHSNYDAPTPDNVKQLANQLLSILSAIPVPP
ncbi:MAG TPA: hypothetical protein VNN22_21885 [Verrucomicrobiae bacterium]|nr:hypothetical protein [Verrucomicrobiae bacterium]